MFALKSSEERKSWLQTRVATLDRMQLPEDQKFKAAVSSQTKPSHPIVNIDENRKETIAVLHGHIR